MSLLKLSMSIKNKKMFKYSFINEILTELIYDFYLFINFKNEFNLN